MAVDGAEFFAQERLRWREKEFQREVITMLRTAGYTHVYHSYFSDRSEKGFPDLVAVGVGKRTLYVELKTMRGKLTAAQESWADVLRAAGETYYEWRPCCFNSGEIQSVISQRWLIRNWLEGGTE